jgi:hypothetical protein
MLNNMSRARLAGVWVAALMLGLLLFTQPLQGQDQSRYRNFQLGSDLSSVSTVANRTATQAKTIHQRPAVIQELEWRPPYFASGSTAAVPERDPVERVVFSFYNDQLFRIVVDYDRDRTSGMTDADMIDALATTYGPPLIPSGKNARTVTSQIAQESGTPVAQWGDADSSVMLYRSSDLYRSSSASRFRIILTSPRVAGLARTAEAQAVLLDEREAPQREIARQKKEAEDTRVSEEKARVTNKAAFRP